MRKANFAGDKAGVLFGEMAFEVATCSLPTISNDKTPSSEVRSRITAKVSVCRVAQRSSQRRLELKERL